MTDTPLAYLFSTLLKSPGEWAALMFNCDGSQIMIKRKEENCYLALVPSTRGGADFAGFIICYCTPDGQMLAVDVDKEHVVDAVKRLYDHKKVKTDDNYDERYAEFKRFFQGLNFQTVTTTIRVAGSLRYYSVPAFSVKKTDREEKEVDALEELAGLQTKRARKPTSKKLEMTTKE